MAAQRPSVWIEFGMRLGQVLLPLVLKYLTRCMPPEEEAGWREAERLEDKRIHSAVPEGV
jgi:hypothetical protein